MRMMIMATVLGLASLAACGGDDCEELCEAANACDSAGLECQEFCDGLAIMRETNCGKEYDALLDCEREADDICAEDVCEGEANALGLCALLYCGQDFDEPGCDQIRDGLSN